MACFAQHYLFAGLLEKAGHIGVVGEIAEPFRSDDALRKFLADEPVELVQVECRPSIIYECAYAIFLDLATLVIVMVFVVMVMLVPVMMFFVVIIVIVVVMPVFMFVIIVMVVVLVLVFVMLVSVVVVLIFVFIIVLVVMMFFILVFVDVALDSTNPSGALFGLAEFKDVGIQQLFDIYFGVVTLDNLCLSLYLAYDFLDFVKRFRRNFGRFVEEYYVAELNLLNDKVFNIFLVKILALQTFTASELVCHTECVNHCHDAVQPWSSELRVNSADGLH